jgi:PAS domain S-box-containing protein
MLGIALIYILLTKVTFTYLYNNGEASIIWLPSGIGFGLLLQYGKRYWPAIFVGTLAGYMLVLDRTLLHSASVALFSNTLEPIIGVWLLSILQYRGIRFNATFSDPADFIILSITAVISSFIASISGCVLLNLFGIFQWDSFLVNMLHWWMGNLLGILLITPLMMNWRKLMPTDLDTTQYKIEMLSLLTLSFIFGQILFMGWLNSFFGNITGSYWIFVFVCWGALRFGLHGTLLIISIIAIQSVIGASQGLGIFGKGSNAVNLVNTWFYLVTLSLVGMLLSTVIQKRRQSDEQLAESEMRWKYALEGAGDGVWDWNLQTNTVILSKNWKGMLGYAEHEVSNALSEWESRVHPADKESVLADIKAYLDGKNSTYVNEHRMQCKDGSWKWILDRGMVFNHTYEGKPQRMVGTHTDITRHKQLESALKQSEEDLYTLFAQSPDGIIVMDKTRSILHVNQAFCQITGIDYDSLITIKEEKFDSIMQELCGEKSKYPATTNVQHHSTVSFALQSNLQPKRRATDCGEQFDIFIPEHRVLLRSLIELDQQRLSRVMYFRDITAETLVDRMKSEFLSTAAHELRTPMSIILGYAELLKLKSFDKNTENRMVDSIHDQSQSIVTLLNELLDLARIEAGAGKAFNMKKVPIAPVIETLAETFMLANETRKVKLLPLPELPDLMIDNEKITQALKNCLSNAFKFSDKTSEVSMEVAINHKDDEDESEVAITIRDHGIGMTQQQLARIFEKFYRADTTGEYPGTGLGMSLIKEIIEHHHGQVIVESEYGKGTSITIILPVFHTEHIAKT